MAYVLVNPDGTSNAKPGDKVVTGGGIYEKLADGTSRLVEKLPGIGTTKNYSDVVSAFSKLASGSGGAANNISRDDLKTTQQPDLTVDSVGANGELKVSVAGYDPGDYNTAYKTTGGPNLSTVMGYVVLGLVGVALLDRFMNGGGDRG